MTALSTRMKRGTWMKTNMSGRNTSILAGASIALLTIFTLIAGCTDSPPNHIYAPQLAATTVASFNLANLASANTREEAARLITDRDAEVVTVQECRDCATWVKEIGTDYVLAGPNTPGGVGIIVDSTRFESIDGGQILLGDNDDGWGQRYARWELLSDIGSSDELLIYSTHFCVPIRNDIDRCTQARQLDYADKILRHRDLEFHSALPTIIAGDFNAFGGFAMSDLVASIRGDGYIETYLEAGSTPAPQTFRGNDWAPPGRIDFIFAATPAIVSAADITAPIDPDLDHAMVSATVSF